MINRPSDVTNFNGLLQSAQAALNNEKDEMDPNVMDAAKELRALLSVSTVMIFKSRLLTPLELLFRFCGSAANQKEMCMASG